MRDVDIGACSQFYLQFEPAVGYHIAIDKPLPRFREL